MENKIKGKIRIVDLIANKKKYDLSEKYRESLNSYNKQFDEFKSDYEHLKEQEPLKSKIETLKKVFSFDEKNYNTQNPGPADGEIACVKDLCECCKIYYYKTLGIGKGSDFLVNKMGQRK